MKTDVFIWVYTLEIKGGVFWACFCKIMKLNVQIINLLTSPVDNIKMDLREIGIQLAQDRVQWRACVNTVMNLRVL
jgi:hypothetical protein